jgi:hypothetical protein
MASLMASLMAVASAASSAADAPAAPASDGIVTILEGEASVIQGKDRTEISEGLHLAPGAIITTSAHTGLLRIEVDHVAIDLGPDTRALLSPDGLAARGSPRPALYLLQGWAKLSGPAGSPIAGIASMVFMVPAQQGVSVAFVAPDSAEVFVESGELQLMERHGGKPSAALTVHADASYQLQGSERGKESPHQSAAMLEHLPRAYRDTLPMHAAMFDGKEPEPKPLAAPSYEDLQPWLDAEPALRRGFVRRFAIRARELDFRKSLIANLAAHPEWRPVLFPPEPRHRPPPPPPATAPPP